MKAYHFTSHTLRDGSPIPPIGEWLEFKGDVEICKSGLHYSKEPFDALQCAPGDLLHLVEVEDIVTTQNDKGVCRRRKILATIDATELLRKFARDQALSVYHLWGNKKTDPNGVCKRYLETGDESLRASATVKARAEANAAYAAWNAAYATAYAARATAFVASWAVPRKEFNKRVKEAFKGAMK